MSIDFGAGTDVHTTRRFFHQKDGRLDAQPFAKRHFLLVAARQLACLVSAMSPIDFEECGQSLRQFGLPPPTDEATNSDTVECRRTQVFGDAPYGKNAIALAIIG